MCKMPGYFTEMQDYRQSWKIRHLLKDIIVIIICATVSVAENISEIGLWAKCKEGVTNGEKIPIDGKGLRGSKDCGNKVIYMVSEWSRTNGIVLGEEKADKKSNEIKAIPKLLKMLEIKGCIVTIDAMGCQKKISEEIAKKEAEYVLALKKNHKNLHTNAETFFENCDKCKDCHCQTFDNMFYDSMIEEDKGHGRIETWHYYITNDLSQIACANEWVNLKSIGMTISQREMRGVITRKIRYHLCSIEPDALKYAEAVRGHWAIENSLHWVLDVVFHEDIRRNRKDNRAENMAVIQHTALNLMKKKLEWDHDYAMSLIFGDIQLYFFMRLPYRTVRQKKHEMRLLIDLIPCFL